MKVMIVGGGGREHAIAWAVAKSPKCDKLYAAPGNAGIAELAECVNISVMDADSLVAFAKEKEIDFVIVAPDDPLAAGVADAFLDEGIKTFGPRKNAAIIEASKAFSKDLMKKYNIPSAAYETFESADEALAYLETQEAPYVLKADGLALGKGVLICNTLEEAKAGIQEIMVDKKFGEAGNKVVIEEFMTGREVSVLCFSDGKTILPMTSAQDHKRAGDGDTGLNTGGMGTFSPSPFYTDEIAKFCEENVYQRTIDAMAAEGREFKGVLFCGLMLTEKGPRVLEFNARFGDPEAQVVIPRLKNDLLDVMIACADGTLDQVDLQFEDNAAVCVMLASDGYPVSYEKGYEIRGLENFKDKDGYYVFHSGTKFDDAGKVVTNGGRVIGVTALGENLVQARANAYKATELLDFDNKYMRHDIGKAIDEQ
ncbi:MAG: phosphoribosylamine--glycine ligase [Eubacterium sp.]|nr:phosphoribosylamine--glycine ligase [Eubacterium sp.]